MSGTGSLMDWRGLASMTGRSPLAHWLECRRSPNGDHFCSPKVIQAWSMNGRLGWVAFLLSPLGGGGVGVNPSLWLRSVGTISPQGSTRVSN